MRFRNDWQTQMKSLKLLKYVMYKYCFTNADVRYINTNTTDLVMSIISRWKIGSLNTEAFFSYSQFRERSSISDSYFVANEI